MRKRLEDPTYIHRSVDAIFEKKRDISIQCKDKTVSQLYQYNAGDGLLSKSFDNSRFQKPLSRFSPIIHHSHHLISAQLGTVHLLKSSCPNDTSIDYWTTGL